MSINKNFVIRNGLEVNTNLILADTDLGKVGIGSTVPRFELDVAGGIGATDVYVSGVATFIGDIKVGSDGSVLSVVGAARSVGVGTEIPAYLLDVRSATSTGTTALYVQGDVRITGDLSVDDINFDQANINSLNVVGVATVGSLGVIGLTTSANLIISGVSTLGTIKVSSGIVTATSGIITYYGDGSKLTNIVSGVGISSLGTFIGAGATILNFIGTAVSTVTVSSGIATIKLDGGSNGGGIPGGSNLQVQYNNSGVFAGSPNFTFDGNNVNVSGIVTAIDFNSTSDKNLKKNIKTVDNAIDIIRSLRGVSFDWRETGKSSYGVIAQELEQVLPELVTNTDPKTVNYNGIIGILIEAIKEMSKQIEELKNSK